jgi:beta-lactam-binding protein with PASTA domain
MAENNIDQKIQSVVGETIEDAIKALYEQYPEYY